MAACWRGGMTITPHAWRWVGNLAHSAGFRPNAAAGLRRGGACGSRGRARAIGPARAGLPAVDDEVVRQRAGTEELVAGGGGEQPEIVGVRHRERMVGRDRAPLTVDPLEQREVD